MLFQLTLTLIIRVGIKLLRCFDSIVVQCLFSLVSLDKSKVFVTVPRFSEGIPASLGYIKAPSNDLLIQPYPDYSWHSSHGSDCNGLTSIVRVAVDECHRLYALDTGVIGSVRKCPPQLVVFNLVNDKFIKRYKFPKSQYSDVSLFITPVRLVVSISWQKVADISFTDSRRKRSTTDWAVCQHKSLCRWRDRIFSDCLRLTVQ